MSFTPHERRIEREALGGHVRRRIAFLAGFSFLALGAAFCESGVSVADAGELASALGQASHSVVRGDDVRWEPSSGAFSDLAFGRFALFLGSETEGAPRDLYRARIRLSPEGHLLGIAAIRNLTATPLGDDHALVIRNGRAAFATFAFGQEQSVTVLDLSGEGAQNLTKKIHDRAMAWVTNIQQTGTSEGIARTDVTLDQTAQRVGLTISDDTLDIALADDDRAIHPTRRVRFDFSRGELTPATVSGMHADAARHLPKRAVFWAVDTVRAVPWIGPAPIAWLEEKTFAVRDTFKQTFFKMTSGGEALAQVSNEPPPPIVLDASQASADLGHWPPPSVRSIWKTPEPGEGEWTEPTQPWIKRFAAAPGKEKPPSPFYQTFVRPDEERPYAKVLLVAMDMRQLDLDMEAGSEDPKPMTGPPGTGRIPRDPAVYTRIAAAFNGGFKTEHGSYGMMLRKRVLLPAVPGVATVILTKDNRVGMGSWGQNHDVGGIVDVEPSDIVSFRQNLDPLVDNDSVNPLNRAQWGYTLPGTSVQTERSGICITNAGHLMYAWGDDVGATALGKAMKMGGCIYGMHLDMNPYHTGFIFTNITDLKGKNYQSELLTKQMEISPDRYISYAPKDFFYVTLHDPTPSTVDGAKWEPDPGVQPAPAFVPALYRTRVGDIDLFDVESGRASFRIRAGTDEPEAHGKEALHELADDDAHRVLFALTMGTAETKRPRGLVTDGRVASPASSSEQTAMLVTDEDGSITIGEHAATAPPHGDMVELPLLVQGGKTASIRHVRGGAALGITASGRVLVARGRNASADDLATLLIHAGCTQAVLLDRGAGTRGTLLRAGTEAPPRSRSEDTVLFAMGKPLVPRGFRFEAQKPVVVAPPKKK